MEILEKLDLTKKNTLKYFALTNEELDKNYGLDKWTVRYILHHIADAETVLYDRIRRVISEPKQVIWAFNQDAWAKSLDYSNVPLELSRNIYTSVREAIIYYARIHYTQNGYLEFVHSETGIRTLKDEFDKVVWHNEKHLEQIQKSLES
jgi:hypothetical protein